MTRNLPNLLLLLFFFHGNHKLCKWGPIIIVIHAVDCSYLSEELLYDDSLDKVYRGRVNYSRESIQTFNSFSRPVLDNPA